jgi:hypothetical protein
LNFLAHDYVLPWGSTDAARVGSALPDLWPLLPRRSLPLVVLRKLRDVPGDPQVAALAAGIDSHLRSDAAFHGHPEFRRRVELLTPHVVRAWPGLRHGTMAAHVLVEMLLDRWLIRQYPSRLDQYYAAFSADVIDLACAWTASDQASSLALRRMLHGFVESAFLRDYAQPTGLALRFLRTVGRTPFGADPPPAHTIAALVDSMDAELDAGSSALLDDVRASA